jgi:hypothetical protein
LTKLNMIDTTIANGLHPVNLTAATICLDFSGGLL